MAGGGESVDNPVGINVVPMVDVIFCLCVFFMCSFQLHGREGRLEAWLPKDLGTGSLAREERRELRVALYWNEVAGVSSIRYGSRELAGASELEALLRGARDDSRALGLEEVPLVLDGDPRVPWNDVLGVMNVGTRVGIESIRLACGQEDA